ncbi:MAG TPA: glycosyltransferase family 39 protein [Candidatus Binataceae bacterium]|nr:glycosyltransferase family 39 protein [Candidatus Binataceae bacterium]
MESCCAAAAKLQTMIVAGGLPRSLLPCIAMSILLIVGSLVLTKNINEAPLIDWDEATYAEVAHQAVANHSYLDFTWNGQPYLKKPPILFWALAISFKSFGESEFSARLPSVIMGVGTTLLIYAMAAAEFGPLAGLLAGILPFGFYFFLARGGRECATDAPLIFFSTLAMFALDRARSHRGWAAICGIACGLAMLSKGAAGLIPLTAAIIAVLVIPTFTSLGFAALISIVGMSVAVAAPWFLYQLVHNGPIFWTTYVKDETLLRIVDHLEDKPASAGFTARTFLTEIRYLWPITLPLAGLAHAAFRSGIWRTLRSIPPLVRVWLLWFVLALGAACAVQTKLGWYILPALIPTALLSASIVAGAFLQSGPSRAFCLPLAVCALLLLAFTAVPRWSRIEWDFAQQRAQSRPSYEMAMRAVAFAAVRGGGELYFAGPPLPTLVYYSGMRCHFVSPAEPDFELADLGGNPISVSYHELVLRDPRGTVTAIDNFGDEWNASSPIWKRAHPFEQNLASPVLDVRPIPE